jgi:tetratricopeptide (TPR) repeat protein
LFEHKKNEGNILLLMKNQIPFFIFLLLLLFVQPINILAQNKSSKKTALKMSKRYLSIGDYKNAIPFLLRLDTLEPKNAQYLYLTGVAYLNYDNQAAKAAYYFKKCTQQATFNMEAFYFLGQSLHLNNHLDEAIMAYREYLKMGNKNKFENRLIINAMEQCEHAKVLIATPLQYEVLNLPPPINSIYNEKGSALSSSGKILYLASNRPSIYPVRDPSFEKIFKFKCDNDQWSLAEELGNPFKSQGHVAVSQVTYDNRKLVLSRWDEANKGDIFIMKFVQKNQEKKPLKVNKNLFTTAEEINASITADSSIIYFSGQLTNNIGGRDIYVSKRLTSKQWSKPEIVGISTPYDDDCPLISPDGNTLYFSSKGHYSMGGYDVFKAVYENGNWSQPANVGYPINSTADELYYYPNIKTTKAYVSSNRPKGNGGWDIYAINYESEILNETNVVILKGKIIDARTKRPVKTNFTITANDTITTVMNAASQADIAEFSILLPVAPNYSIVIEADSAYNAYSNNYTLAMPLKPYNEITAVIERIPSLQNATANDSIPIMLETKPGDVTFKIWVDETKTNSGSKIPLTELEYISNENLYDVYTGNFSLYSQAMEQAAILKFNGLKTAKVVAFFKGKAVTFEVNENNNK